MAFCLVKSKADKFKQMLISGEISPKKLNAMSSKERTTFFSENFGKDAGKQINALYESKLLLKNQKAGMIRWAKKVLKDKPTVYRRSVMDRINKLDKALEGKELDTFLGELVEAKVGFEVTDEQYDKLAKLGKEAQENKEIALSKLDEDGRWKSKEDKNKYGIDFGASKVAFDNYLTQLSELAKGKKLKNIKEAFKEGGTVRGTLFSLGTGIDTIAENARAIVASLDNSFFGRQGMKALTRPATSRLWVRSFIKSFSDIGKTLVGGVDAGNKAMDATKAEIYSRENYLNGRYELGKKLDVGIREEEFPTSLPEKIPGLGRLFKASEVAYSAGAMRMRADIADQFYKAAEKTGVNLNNREEVGAINEIVNIMTGRGSLGSYEQAGKSINKIMFSAKFVASQVQSITKIGTAKTAFARKQAAYNLLSLVTFQAILMAVMKVLWPERTEDDPTSSNFTKVRVGNMWIDFSGGAGSYAVLAERIRRQQYKNSYTGIITKLNDGYGTPDGMDVFFDFISNKTSPAASVVKDLIRQRTFEGDKPTLFNEARSLMTPIIVSTGKEAYETNEKKADLLLAIIADGMGLSVSNYVFESNWDSNITDKLQEYKDKVGEKTFKEANDEYNRIVSEMYLDLAGNESYQKKDNDARQKYITNKKAQYKREVMADF